MLQAISPGRSLPMKDVLILRLYALVLLLSLIWLILGAPILPVEWQDVPNRLAIMSRQLPRRMGAILVHWH